MRANWQKWLTGILATGLLLGAGCKKEEAAPAAKDGDMGAALTDMKKQAEGAAGDMVKVNAQLAAADVLDGKTDKTVSKCMMCAFRMAGSADHASSYKGYKLEFCGEPCQKKFDAEPDKYVLAADIPIPSGE